MLGYSDDIKEEVKAANDIVEVISNYVQLKRKGRYYFGLCPFHSENSPSFSVKPDGQYFHCFGCHAGGDVIAFIRRIENKTYPETIEYLAERANIKLPTINRDDPQSKLKDRMFAIYADSTMFYHEKLYKPLAKKAQEYVKRRKLNQAMLEQFKIGYSTENWNDLYKFLHNKGYTDKEIEATGLCIKSKRGEYIDFFRNRLMFPVMNVSGKVMAFGGRKLDDEDKKSPKYLNSNDSLIFKKRENLFALNFAKKSTSKTLILVEGYMDVISLHQRGIDIAVASLGTALTEGQGKLIRKYSEKLIFSYDADDAGRNAILAGDEVLEKIGIEGRVLQMNREDAKDPDEYIIKYGSGRFKLLMDNAISMIEYKTQMLRKNYNLDIANEKIAFLREVAKLIAGIESKVEREIYIDKISKSSGISKEAIFADVNKLLYSKEKDSNKVITKVTPVPKESVEKAPSISKAEIEREKMILYFLIKNTDEVGKEIISKVDVDDFKVEKYKNIYNQILDIMKNGNTNIYNILINTEDMEIQSSFSEIMFSEYEINSVQKFIEDIINNYEKNKLNFRKNEILEIIKSNNLEKEENAKLMQELNSIMIELAKMK
jgi:DNA primase